MHDYHFITHLKTLNIFSFKSLETVLSKIRKDPTCDCKRDKENMKFKYKDRKNIVL